jgi:hypothetical protein
MLPRFLALGIIGDYYYEKNWNTSDENIWKHHRVRSLTVFWEGNSSRHRKWFEGITARAMLPTLTGLKYGWKMLIKRIWFCVTLWTSVASSLLVLSSNPQNQNRSYEKNEPSHHVFGHLPATLLR